jgi:hypothetical protein
VSPYSFAHEVDVFIAPQDQEINYTYDNHEFINLWQLGEIALHKTGTITNTSMQGDDANTPQKTVFFRLLAETEAPLADVVFHVIADAPILDTLSDAPIFARGDVVAKLVTDLNGNAVAKNLLPGKYILREVSAPDAYVLSPDKSFTIQPRKDSADGVAPPHAFFTWDILNTLKPSPPPLVTFEEPDPPEPVPTPPQSALSAPQPVGRYKTADPFDPHLWIILGAASIAALIVSVRMRRRMP